MSDKSRGFTEAAVEGVKAVAPGLTLANILKDVGSEMKQMAAHGAHELAAALFNNGSGFVMYPRGTREDPEHGLAAEAQKPQQEAQQERGGRSL